ncbi:PREDICTED: uncharacterized protein LOC104805289 isoform X2 [Tarenaya hassleriana]|uniref:uncharacterized protein LOC104805289 isoform X2 n=1 Tax=Tarenaya hassleriana TaxID=28532 RepID=UPI00053C3BBE|nr:PREDICTED: uncharacterized protein LOC104805289 isoform X2 [Tarenaya hassleriana]
MEEERRLGDELSLAVVTAERLRQAADEAESFKLECGEVGKQVDRLAQMLRTLVRLVTGSVHIYDRPIHRVIVEVQKNLERALALVRKCKGHSIIRRVCSITNAADFRKVINLLESSNGDVKWLLSVFDSNGDDSFGGGINISLPPIATNDPILPWVWSLIASTQMGRFPDKIEAANQLGSLARDNDRNKKIIVDEGGIPSLLRLLKESSSVEAQIAAATTLRFLASDQDKMNKEIDRDPSQKSYNYKSYMSSNSSVYSDTGGGRAGHYHRKERESENPEVKHQLKVSCAEALWKLARGNVANSRRITETKGLLSLAKSVEKEVGELQYNCLMTLTEITAAAESSADLRRAAFKTNSPAAKAVVDQMLWLLIQVDSPFLLVPAIRSIGSLARTFPARETRIIKPLVMKLGCPNQEVAMEAVVSLQKFASHENFLCAEHSKAIIEFGAIPSVMKLIRNSDQQVQLQCLILLCYFALNASNHEQLEQAKVLSALEGADRVVISQNPDFKELATKAIYQLSLYNVGLHSQILSYVGP